MNLLVCKKKKLLALMICKKPTLLIAASPCNDMQNHVTSTKGP